MVLTQGDIDKEVAEKGKLRFVDNRKNKIEISDNVNENGNPTFIKATPHQEMVFDVAPALGTEESAPEISSEEQDLRDQMEELYKKFDMDKSDSRGWVQKHEVKLVKERIKNMLGFDPPPMCGWKMCVMVHEKTHVTHKDGTKSRIMLADISKGEEKYRQCVGMVVSQGEECYTGPRFEESFATSFLRIFFNRWMKPKRKPWCRVGDFVVFEKHEGDLLNYRNIPMMIIPDTKIHTPVEHPDYVTRFF